jgi:hypothetical protein
VVGFREGGADAVGDELATGDGHVVETDHASTVFSRSNFSNVELFYR